MEHHVRLELVYLVQQIDKYVRKLFIMVKMKMMVKTSNNDDTTFYKDWIIH